MKSLHVFKSLLPVFVFWMMTMPVEAKDVSPPLPGNDVEFTFYGQTLNVAKLNTVKVKSVCGIDVAEAWHVYKKRNVPPVMAS